jgi:integrase
MGLYKRGQVWWMSFVCQGKHYRHSTQTTNKKLALEVFYKLKGEIAEGKLPGIFLKKAVTFEDLAEDFLTDYQINGRDTLNKAERSVKYLKTSFEGMRAADITTDKVKTYIKDRMSQGLSNASINRELAALKRMFHLVAECTPPKVTSIPHIPMLKESNVRKGFFEYSEYLALKDALPGYLKPIVSFGYFSGWRISEILGLTWDRVDLKEGKVRLDPGETKNEEGRTLYLNKELMEEMEALHRKRQLGCPYVFHRDGKPIKGFRKSWISACIKVGLCEGMKDKEGNPIVIKMKNGGEKVVKIPTKIFHDFRRTAIRDMVRSGISEKVAMTISGHKSRNVFERYNIVNDQDLREAALKFQDYQERKSTTVGILTPKQGEVIQFRHAENE